jgi:septum formation protein
MTGFMANYNPLPMHRSIVLASSSVYRRELLERLGLTFEVDPAGIDESPLAGEAPRETARRLSLAKAEAVAGRHPESIVIGADQVAECEGAVLGKPGTPERALEQLLYLRGRTALFHSGVAMVEGPRRHALADCITTEVVFRPLERAALEAYLLRDQPWDCAGAARIESLGICLVESVRSDDPTALIGLPLIRVTSMLLRAGVALPLI